MIEIAGVRVYDTQEAAAILGMHVRTIRRLLHAGAIVGVRRGGRWYVTEAELRRYVAGESDGGMGTQSR